MKRTKGKSILAILLALVTFVSMSGINTTTAKSDDILTDEDLALSDCKSSMELTQEWFGVTKSTNVIDGVPKDKVTLYGTETNKAAVKDLISQYANQRQSDFRTSGAQADYSTLYANDDLYAVQRGRPAAIVKMQENMEIKIVNAVITCTIQSIEWQDDIANVGMYEWTFFDYNDPSDDEYMLDSSGFGTDHSIKLQKTDNGLVIIGDLYDESDITGIVTQPLYYEEPLSGEDSIEQEPPAPSGILATAPAIGITNICAYTYDAKKAAIYADTYCKKYNPAYPKQGGGDCASFVSQCLKAGGMKTNSTWKPYTTAWNYVNSSKFTSLKSYFSKIGTYKAKAKNSEIKIGDIIFTNNLGHVMICTGKNKNGPYYDGHTNDSYHMLVGNSNGIPAILFTSCTGKIADIVLTASVSPTSVTKTGKVTCKLTTNQAATKVTATLDGNAAKAMTGSGKNWSCTFSPFTSTGTRTVTFSATGTNGKAVKVKKTFTVKSDAANIVLTASISPTSVTTAGKITCTLKTDQNATKVTATLDGNPTRAMTGSGKSWSYTFSPFTSTGTRTVTFSATGTNGKAITVKKTFKVTAIPDIVLTASVSPTSVSKTGTITCTLKTDQNATKVTATLDGNPTRAMTGSGKSWSYKFSPFTSTGTRTVTFSATGTNGKTVTVKKTFTVK